MDVWLLHPGEDLPVDRQPRKFRYSYLAEALAARGGRVLRWAPTFRHYQKEQRFDADTRVDITPGYQVQFIHAPGYQTNASLKRIQMFRRLAKRFREIAERGPRPDLIVSAIPSLEWSDAVLKYAKPRGIPVVVDIRDFWPDLYLTAAPRPLRPLARAALSMEFARVRRICRGATALTGMCQSILDWGLAYAGRAQRPDERVFPLGYEAPPLGSADRAAMVERLVGKGLDPARIVCCFAGLLENSCDLHSVVEVARRLHTRGDRRLQFVLCGSGRKEQEIRERTAGLDNVVLLGWVDQATIAAVMSVSKIGLVSYGREASQTLPNKPFEYMAGRLALASSLPRVGELADLIREHGCGVQYDAGSSDSLEHALIALADDPNQLEQMRASAAAAFAERYDAAVIYPQMAAYLESVVAKQPAALAA